MRTRWIAGGLGLLAVVASSGSVAASLTLGWTFAEAVEAFVVSNIVIGLSFALSGTLIAWHRPRLPLGWLYAAGGVCPTLTALAAPLAQVLQDSGAPTWLVRLDLTVYQWAWPLHIGIALPLSLLLLPDGRLASRRWRSVAWVVAATSPLFVLAVGLAPVETGLPGLPEQYLTLSSYDQLSWLWTIDELRWSLSMLIGLVCMGVRYRAGSETVRRQLLWLLSAVAIIIVAVTPWALVAGTPIVVLFAIPLLPAAVAVAVLRYQLLDIRLVLARGATYGALTATLAGIYLASVLLLQFTLAPVTANNSLAVAASTLAVAALFRPARRRIQAGVNRRFYRSRYDAELTLERFRTYLRDQINLDAIGDELRAAADTTLQPAHVSLWLREARPVQPRRVP
ncbi:MAG: hypothetical protein M4D85_00340 [Actinomycetota bacterium]|nr:hypothetical protein [Actinomycetota bacterium]